MPKTKTKKPADKIVLRITPETVMKDQGMFEACLFLASVFNRKPRRACVRKAVIDQLKQTGIMLLAQDGDLKQTLDLLDKDAIADAADDGDLSLGRELVKPLKRKKAVARRR